MQIHHLNCISTCPVGGRLMDARTDSIVRRGELSCHCLLVEKGARHTPSGTRRATPGSLSRGGVSRPLLEAEERVAADRGQRLHNQDRLRALRRTHANEIELVCSHDIVELERLAGRSAAVPEEHIAPELAPA